MVKFLVLHWQTSLGHLIVSITNYLLIAKLNAYGFRLPALKLVYDYLSNRRKRTKVNGTYNSWLKIVFDVLQGSILGPLLLNILANLFFILKDVKITSYADDNTLYVIAGDINGVVASLEKVSKALFEWFVNDLLKTNDDKWHIVASSSNAVSIRISEYDIKKSECEKLLTAKHCAKSVRIRSYSGPYSSAFRLNRQTCEYLSVFSPNARKYESE